jgi:hypothetical protein
MDHGSMQEALTRALQLGSTRTTWPGRPTWGPADAAAGARPPDLSARPSDEFWVRASSLLPPPDLWLDRS